MCSLPGWSERRRCSRHCPPSGVFILQYFICSNSQSNGRHQTCSGSQAPQQITSSFFPFLSMLAEYSANKLTEQFFRIDHFSLPMESYLQEVYVMEHISTSLTAFYCPFSFTISGVTCHVADLDKRFRIKTRGSDNQTCKTGNAEIILRIFCID